MTHSFLIHTLLVFATLTSLVAMLLFSMRYMIRDHYLKTKKTLPQWVRFLPSLEKIEGRISKSFGVLLLSLSILMINGIILAHEKWSSNWMREPKFMFSVGTWLYFWVLFLIRRYRGLRGHVFFAWLLVGLVFIAVSFAGAYLWS